MAGDNRPGLHLAARVIWPLFVLPALLASGCSSGPPARYGDKLYEGMTLYPNESYHFGPLSFNRLHSILPGSSSPNCADRQSTRTHGSPDVTVFACHHNSTHAMNTFASALREAFVFLEKSSEGKMRFCTLTIGLADPVFGVYAVDTQSLRSKCARLKMLSRWSPDMTTDEQDEAVHSMLRSTAHEAYHIAVDRDALRPRDRPRLDEEVEAALVGACAEQAILGKSTLSTASEITSSATFDSFVSVSVKGERLALQAIRNGKVSEIANSAPVAFKPLLTKCAEVLKLPSQ